MIQASKNRAAGVNYAAPVVTDLSGKAESERAMTYAQQTGGGKDAND